MAGAGDKGVEWVVKHKRFSLPVGLKETRRNRAPTANSSRANGPTYHSFAFTPELIRRAWFVAPSSGSKKIDNERCSARSSALRGDPRRRRQAGTAQELDPGSARP